MHPCLQELTGETFELKSKKEDEDARLDISARNFWSTETKAYFDVKVFNPIAKSYINQTLAATHSPNEKLKKRKYNNRILEVEHGTFTSLVFSCYGGMSKECKHFYKHLTTLIAEKRGDPYHLVCKYIRTKISFCLAKVAVICIRGYRGQKLALIEKLCDTDIYLEAKRAGLADFT